MAELWLHVGVHKTATTTLQALCAHNRDWLQRRGIVYPRMRVGVLQRVSINHRAWASRLLSPQMESAVGYFRQVVPPGERILLSAEGLSLVPTRKGSAARAECLARCLDGYDVTVLLYVRRQDEWYESMHNERVKTSGETRSLEQYVALGLARRYADYLWQWRFWQRFGRVRVRVFEPAALREGDVVADFLAELGIRDRAGMRRVALHNARLHPWLLEPKRALNHHLTHRLTRQLAKRAVVQLQRVLPPAAGRGMSAELAARIMQHHAAGNAALARTLGRTALFGTPTGRTA